MSRFSVTCAAATLALVGVCSQVQAALLSNWNFEGSTTAEQAADTQGYQTCTLAGADLGVSTAAAATGSRSLLFGGSKDDAGQIPGGTTTALGSGSFSGWNNPNVTFITWVNPQGADFWNASRPLLWSKAKQSWNTNGWYVQLNSDNAGTLLVRTDGGSGEFHSTVSNANVPTDQWTQIAVTFNSTTGTGAIYLNGVAQTVTNNGATSISAADAFALLGNNSWPTADASRYQGYMDDTSIWSNDLSGTQVKALYSLGIFSTLKYNTTDGNSLLTAYAANANTTVEGTAWDYVTGMDVGSHVAGDVWTKDGVTYLLMDAGAGAGMATAVPEPSAIVLAAFGLMGLLCYAWRKQK